MEFAPTVELASGASDKQISCSFVFNRVFLFLFFSFLFFGLIAV